MSFIKQRFMKNRCRICQTTFCCIKCRKTHESKLHGIHPDCDICIYGKTYSSHISDSILEHVNKTHRPLHCVNCKIKFIKMTDLKENTFCPSGQKKELPLITKTPSRSALTDVNLFHQNSALAKLQIATSTPINAINDHIKKNLKCLITPVEFVEKKYNKEINEFEDNTPPTAKPKEKRRVTFGDTPEGPKKDNEASGASILKTSLKKTSAEIEDSPIIKTQGVLNVHESSASFKESSLVDDNDKKVEELQESQSVIVDDNDKKIEESEESQSICVDDNDKKTEELEESQSVFVDNNDTRIEELEESQSIFVDDNDKKTEELEESQSVCVDDNTKNLKNEEEKNIVYENLVFNSTSTEALGDSYNKQEEKKEFSDFSECLDTTSLLNVSNNEVSGGKSFWSSVSGIMLNAVKRIKSVSNVNKTTRAVIKRQRSETDLDGRNNHFKRMKITDIKCRPLINDRALGLKPLFVRSNKVHKSTQTDEYLWNVELGIKK